MNTQKNIIGINNKLRFDCCSISAQPWKRRSLGIKTALLCLIASYLWIPGTAFTAESRIIGYVLVTGHYKDANFDFRDVVRKSINNLKRFRVSTKVDGVIAPVKSIKEKLRAARKAGIRWVANVSLSTEKREGLLSFKIYRTNGENTFNWKEEFRIKNVKSFLALMEYEMPKKLKIRFLELGRVIKKDKRLIYFDLGETAGVKPGDIYEIYKEGDEITDNKGNSYGNLEIMTGVVKVTSVTSIYSIGEIKIGALAIRPKHYVRLSTHKSKAVTPEILSMLESEVAINIGKNVGVEEGNYYSVYRDIKKIRGNEAFRQVIGHIKINEVYEDFSKGELSISDTFELTRNIINKGDRVEEVESPRKPMWSVNSLMTNVDGGAGKKIYYATYQRDSSANVSMVYRFKGGYDSGQPMLGFGVMKSIKHSSHFFTGLEVLYFNAIAVHLFVSVDVDTPISKNLKINLESGFIIAQKDDAYNGISSSIGLKYGFELF